MSDDTSATFATAFGPCRIAWSAKGVSRLRLPEVGPAGQRIENADSSAPSLPPPAAAAVAALRRYFTGERTDFSPIELDLDGVGDFHRRAYDALRGIGWGATITYADLARQIGGGPGDARAVGQAMGRNPVPVIIPCHRVLAAGNRIGGFSAPGGTASKEMLLALEGVAIGPPTLPMDLPVQRRPAG